MVYALTDYRNEIIKCSNHRWNNKPKASCFTAKFWTFYGVNSSRPWKRWVDLVFFTITWSITKRRTMFEKGAHATERKPLQYAPSIFSVLFIFARRLYFAPGTCYLHLREKQGATCVRIGLKTVKHNSNKQKYMGRLLHGNIKNFL